MAARHDFFTDFAGSDLAYESVGWRINAERAVLLGWGTAMLMQFAHPLVAAGVAEHSVALAHPKQRLHRIGRTIEAMLALTFGTPAEAARAARRINAIHDRVHGRLGASAGAFPAGTRYSAHDSALLLWVHATLLYALPRAYELVVGPLANEEKDRFCAEGAGMAAVLGIPEGDMPLNVRELQAYLDGMLASGAIVVGETARMLAGELLSPPHGPLIYLPTVGLLPSSIRDQYGLRWGAGYDAALSVAAAALRRVLPLVPARWRYWPAARVAARAMDAERIHTPSHPKLTLDSLRQVGR